MGKMTRLIAGSKGRLSRASFSKTAKQSGYISTDPNLAAALVGEVSEDVMKEFLPILVERFQDEIKDYNIGFEGDLQESFKSRKSKSGNTVRGEVRFNFYGRFVDMGVGKGVSLSERQSGRQVTKSRNGLTSKRQPKPWYSTRYLYEKDRLQAIMAQRLQEIALQVATPPSQTIPIPV